MPYITRSSLIGFYGATDRREPALRFYGLAWFLSLNGKMRALGYAPSWHLRREHKNTNSILVVKWRNADRWISCWALCNRRVEKTVWSWGGWNGTMRCQTQRGSKCLIDWESSRSSGRVRGFVVHSPQIRRTAKADQQTWEGINHTNIGAFQNVQSNGNKQPRKRGHIQEDSTVIAEMWFFYKLWMLVYPHCRNELQKTGGMVYCDPGDDPSCWRGHLWVRSWDDLYYPEVAYNEIEYKYLVNSFFNTNIFLFGVPEGWAR